ncbi:MAG: polysaccharide biosynthesis tyrosine autokinase [Chloroflexi bacterium]|jgi:non-specific protein-tyrosine kinase|nr:polysaccharide biosynthesis tyrosine autokinase [Chloroflexota bacterium]
MNLITLTDPRSPVSEAYRTLRTNLSFYSLDNPIRSLVVTSPAADEGKNQLVANLAVTMAQSGRRTVLVDCDLRRPSLHSFFDLESEPGLTDRLLSEVDELPLQQTSIENLFLLASGPKPPNPADMLGTKKIDEIIATLVEQFDIVLFDTPPVIAVTDAAVLGVKVDGALLVINAGKTRRDQAERAKELLEKARVRIIGAALTNAPRDSGGAGYYG